MSRPTIAKVAARPEHFRRSVAGFDSARAAFAAVLAAAQHLRPGPVCLPAYIGWSAREGSGVFDPVREAGLTPAFYPLDEALNVDLDGLARTIRASRPSVVVLIHYFGRPDPAYQEAARLARDAGAFVIEDEAHALFGDLVAGTCGRVGDACLWSLHKLLPTAGGGVLAVNPDAPAEFHAIAGGRPGVERQLLQYDLVAIAERRRANVAALEARLASSPVRPLWPGLAPEHVLQTYPVLVPDGTRDELYHRLNGAGVGVVSLYHTMISELPPDRFPAAASLSRRILNLPVHQDAAPADMTGLVDALVGALAELGQPSGGR